MALEDSIIVFEDLVEAKCRHCGDWKSNKVSRDNHEAKHTDSNKKYDEMYRHPETKETYTPEELEEKVSDDEEEEPF